jgi:hypothetical protein
MAKIEALSVTFLASCLRGDRRAQQFSFVDSEGQPMTRATIVDELRFRGEEIALVEQEDAQALALAGK